MTALENEILRYFRGCRCADKQVRIVAELTATSVETVLAVLRKHGEIPEDVDKQNYKKRLKAVGWRKLTDGERKYIVGSAKYPPEISSDLGIPIKQVLSVRRRAELEALKNEQRNDD